MVQQYYEKQFECCKSYMIIFMDIDMPIKNGFETTVDILTFFQTLRQTGFNGQPPIIIAYSAFIDNQTIIQSKHVGMSDYINKPATLQQLESLLIKWIKI
eukprot:TRINITY_DN6873_c0_g1_i2.p3 TRINITY_DN6873_c0_g1~~TRINITY_DN6873_c0_g1_i2.p3  ORF type:complete len:100 (+),score=2.95 TRINITY_DN6873_c0_g1_i2:241-540(+)